MIGHFCLVLSVLGFSQQVPDAIGNAIVDEVRAVLDRKAKVYPYHAEYETGLPPQPNPAGWSGLRRYFAESADRMYVEETSPFYNSKVLVGPKTISFSYDGPPTHALCTGPIDLAGTTPEHFLKKHHFPVVPLSQLDASLVATFRQLLAGSTVLREDKAGDVRTYHLTTHSGSLVIMIGPDSVEASRPVEGKKPAQRLFRYFSGAGKPPWIGEVDSFSAKFDDPKEKIHRLVGDFTWGEAIDAADPEYNGKMVVVDAAGQLRLARRHGYLLPDPSVVKIVEAKSVNGELIYKIESGGTTYEIGQCPRISRIRDDNEVVIRFTRGKRRLGDYVVLDVDKSIPNVEGNWLYFFKGDITIIVQDASYKKLPFEDRNLDCVIEAFAPPKPLASD